MLSRTPGREWLADHRRVWARKSSLRLVYGRWFQALREACAPAGPIVEIGCGPGLFKEQYPDVVATDVEANPYAERIVDAAALPFADREVGSLVMLDVFHHLPRPVDFLREAARVLRPGGRLVMIEPWLGAAGHVFYRFVHHEECDLGVDPADPWRGADKNPLAGNVALPFLYFRAGGRHLERLSLPLEIVRREPSAGLAWMLSGGFQPFTLLPAALAGAVESVDRLVSLVPSLTASRCLIVLEKLDRTGGDSAVERAAAG
jgi:SAM-dependent methyltransferase